MARRQSSYDEEELRGAMKIVGINPANHRAMCRRLARQWLGPRQLASHHNACQPRAQGLLSDLWIDRKSVV